jgi:hypothetical protein
MKRVRFIGFCSAPCVLNDGVAASDSRLTAGVAAFTSWSLSTGDLARMS